MAPMTRRGRQTAFPNEFLNPQAIVPQVSREESWQLEGVSGLRLLSYMSILTLRRMIPDRKESSLKTLLARSKTMTASLTTIP
jgi:hypothetical protein